MREMTGAQAAMEAITLAGRSLRDQMTEPGRLQLPPGLLHLWGLAMAEVVSLGQVTSSGKSKIGADK
jgi:hypothetical protein